MKAEPLSVEQLQQMTITEVGDLWRSRGSLVDDLIIDQWIVIESFERARVSHEAGDELALFSTIADCARTGLALPRWAAGAFLNGYYAVRWRRAGSWDEAFGKPVPKGVHLAKANHRMKLKPKIYNAVRDILDAEPSTPIDDHLFERVGKECGCSRSVANEIYYEFKRQIDAMLPPKSR
ncbi:MAG: hypothetical protein IBJ07_05855 [Rhizobiaceae bacterium]|nr:hypothetical protein [Rhizobiaceae bacterium]